MPRLPDHIAISPVTVLCPRCKAEPGKVCEIFDGEVEIVHLERIKAALEMDATARKAITLHNNNLSPLE
jgi:hypothetical protein